MRALETGRWMVRSTNTGVTAAIDESGHVVARLPVYTRGALLANVTPRQGMTPYARWGNVPVIVVLAAIFAVVWLRGRR
jgi:apolipoprotein N-acyltransferase